MAGYRVGRIVSADVLDVDKRFGALTQATTMHGTGLAIDVVELADLADQFVQLGLPDFGWWQANVIEFIERTAKYRTLAATAGDDPAIELFLPVVDAFA